MTDTIQRQRLELVSAAPVERQIADWLLSLLPTGRPRRLARMLDPGKDKYRDVPRHVQLEQQKLYAHASGAETWAATLALESGRIGAADIERDTPEAGQAELLARYRDMRSAGVQAIAIYVENALGEHYGGHIFGFYAVPCDPKAIAAQWRGILPHVAEIWPCAQVIRLPLGYHRWARTRGELWYLTDAGELLTIDLDSDLAGGFALITSLQENSAPPALALSSEKGDYAKSAHAATQRPAAPPAARQTSKGHLGTSKFSAAEQADYRAKLREARAYIIAQFDLVDTALDMGSERTRDGITCPCGAAHGAGTKIAIAPGGKAGYNHSQNSACKLPTKTGIDVTNLLMLKHQCTFDQLARKLAPHLFPATRPTPAQPRAAREAKGQQVYRTAAQDAYNAKRCAQRRQEAGAALEAWRAYLGTLELPDSAHIVGDYLHELSAGQHLQVNPTNAQIVQARGLSLRTVQYAFRALEAAKLGKRAGGRGGLDDRPNECAVWTFSRAIPRVQSEIARESDSGDVCTLVDLEHDLIPESVLDLVSAAPATPAIANAQADTLEAWQHAPDAHGAEELSALEPVQEAPALTARQAQPVAPEEAPATCPDSDQPAHASYTPVELSRHKPYTGRSKHALDTEARYALVWETMRQRPEAEQAPEEAQLLLEQPAQPSRPAPQPGRNRPSALDRYLVELARMSEAELAGELKKHRRTIAKHSRAQWLSNIRDRLGLVEQEIDSRGSSTAPDKRRRSQARRPAPASSASVQLTL